MKLTLLKKTIIDTIARVLTLYFLVNAGTTSDLHPEDNTINPNVDDGTLANEISQTPLPFTSSGQRSPKEPAGRKLWESRSAVPQQKQQKRMLPEYYGKRKPSRPERDNSLKNKLQM